MSKTNLILGLGVLLTSVALCPTTASATCSGYPYSFTNGTTADASQVNANFSYVPSCFAPLASPTFTGTIGAASETLTGTLIDTQNSLGNTSTMGYALKNTTAGAVGAPQYSPALQLTGFGWNTCVGTSPTASPIRWVSIQR